MNGKLAKALRRSVYKDFAYRDRQLHGPKRKFNEKGKIIETLIAWILPRNRDEGGGSDATPRKKLYRKMKRMVRNGEIKSSDILHGDRQARRKKVNMSTSFSRGSTGR